MSNDSFSLTGPQRTQTLAVLLLAFLLAGSGSWFWARARGAFEHTISVRFVAPTATGIHVGEVVRLSGVRIGEVADIALNVQARVDVRLEIDTHYLPWLHGNSTVWLDQESLLGDNFVALSPGNDAGGPLADGALLHFARNDSMEEVKQLPQQIGQTLDEIDALAKTLNDPNADLRTSLHEMRELLSELHDTRRRLDTTLAGIDRLTGERLPQTLANLDTTLGAARSSLATMDRSLDNLDAHGTQTLDDYRKAAADLRAQLAGVQRLLDATQPQLQDLLRRSRGLVDDSDTAVNSARRHWPFSSKHPAAPVDAPAPPGPAGPP